MSLTREQYDEIMRGYMQKQSRRHQLALQRREEVYARIPEFRQLSDKVSEVAVGYLHTRLGEKRKDNSSAPAMPRLKEMAIAAQHAAPAQTLSSSLPEKEKELPAEQKASLKHPDAASVEAFRSSAKRAQLLFVIEQYIGKPLAPSEVESVYYISEQLHFSDALIDYLLQYCIDRGKKDFRYIQKVAVNRAENGITTPKQAERAVSSFGRNRRGATGSGVKASANPFNQFEQNQYDFDQLEKEILGN